MQTKGLVAECGLQNIARCRVPMRCPHFRLRSHSTRQCLVENCRSDLSFVAVCATESFQKWKLLRVPGKPIISASRKKSSKNLLLPPTQFSGESLRLTVRFERMSCNSDARQKVV